MKIEMYFPEKGRDGAYHKGKHIDDMNQEELKEALNDAIREILELKPTVKIKA